MAFPNDFVWGAASSSYQVEGAAFDDGKGLSIWDVFCRRPGAVFSGDTGNIACDHYNRYKEDIAIMKQIGIKAYRLSVSWPRVIPEGVGAVNCKGIDFYDRLIDELCANNIEPWITLFHWDYPYSLYTKGAWLNADSPQWFSYYTKVLVEKLSDRVSCWIPQNEQQCFLGHGLQTGEHAPGLRLDWPDILLATHNSLVAHGLSVQAIRAFARKKPRIGTALIGIVSYPDTEDQTDIDAARSEMFKIRHRNLFNNTWFSDPLLRGYYPEDGLQLFGPDMPPWKADDMKIICQPLDFYGVNIYIGNPVRASLSGGDGKVSFPQGYPMTTMGWQVTPQALFWGPKFIYERYGLPIVITENGMSNLDWVNLDGKVPDPQRIDYLGRHLSELKRASSEGIDCRGFFQWSIMDNFEWSFGYGKRFGLVHVDFQTQKRTLKDSAYWYRDLILENGAKLNK